MATRTRTKSTDAGPKAEELLFFLRKELADNTSAISKFYKLVGNGELEGKLCCGLLKLADELKQMDVLQMLEKCMDKHQDGPQSFKPEVV